MVEETSFYKVVKSTKLIKTAVKLIFNCHNKNILVLIIENFYCLTDFEFEFESVSNYLEISNYNRGDVASLAEDHCSLITRASHIGVVFIYL